jgi:hypothetical protein
MNTNTNSKDTDQKLTKEKEKKKKISLRKLSGGFPHATPRTLATTIDSTMDNTGIMTAPYELADSSVGKPLRTVSNELIGTPFHATPNVLLWSLFLQKWMAEVRSLIGSGCSASDGLAERAHRWKNKYVDYYDVLRWVVRYSGHYLES